jgi:hypothetical protein
MKLLLHMVLFYCPLLMAFFSLPVFLSFFCQVFSQKGLSWGFKILHGVLTYKKNKFRIKTKSGDPANKNLGQNFFGVKNCRAVNNFGWSKILGGQQILGVNKLLGVKIFGVPHFLGGQHFLGVNISFWGKHLFGVNIFRGSKLLEGEKFIGVKKISPAPLPRHMHQTFPWC